MYNLINSGQIKAQRSAICQYSSSRQPFCVMQYDDAISAVKRLPLKPTEVKLRPYGEDNPAPIPLAGSLINHHTCVSTCKPNEALLRAQL